MNEITTKKYKTIKEHGIEAPLALLAELSHRCPLQCPYCSNPVQLEKKTGELTTDEWKSVIDQAVELGMHQIHLSGGEPTVRQDLEEIVENCVFDNLAERNGLAVDYARAFLANVNYHEILEHIIDEIEMNDDYQKMIENYE